MFPGLMKAAQEKHCLPPYSAQEKDMVYQKQILLETLCRKQPPEGK